MKRLYAGVSGNIMRGSSPSGGGFTMSRTTLKALATLGADLEERLGTPQDIEWAVEDGELFVLQARPVTT